MNKKFDCVKMKKEGAEKLQKKLAGLSIKEELMFWQEQNKILLEEQKRLAKRKRNKAKV